MGPLPDDCTGIELINPKKDFQKINCRWVSWNTRAKSQRDKNAKVTCTFVLDKDYHEFLCKQALVKAQQQGSRYHFSDIVRDSLEKCCPFPKTMDMFGKK